MDLIEYMESLNNNNTAITLKNLINTLYYSEDVSCIESNRFLIKSNADRIFLEHAYRFILTDIELFKDNIKIVFYYFAYRVEFHIHKDSSSIDSDINMQVKISNLKKYKIMKEEVSYE